MLTAALAVAAFAAGVAGTWSPCGLSMISTIAERARSRGQARAAVAALTLGCLAGGVVIFCALAGAGSLLGAGVAAPAVAVAVTAAVLDLRGVRVLPQIRNQVPEPWRRHAALPVATGAYGVLLGLGFTTFVMSYTLWGVAVVSLLVGSAGTAVAVGAAFGAGRALPIAVLALGAGSPWADDAQEAMLQRPGALRAARGAAAALMLVVGLAASASPALARSAHTVAEGIDPSVDGSQMTYRRVRDGQSVVFMRRLDGSQRTVVNGERVVLGGGRVATLSGGSVTVTFAGSPAPGLVLPAPAGTDALAVSEGWLAFHSRDEAGEHISAERLVPGATIDGVTTVHPPAQLGRPSLAGDRVAYHVAGPAGSRIVVADLVSHSVREIRRPGAQLLFPALSGDALAYVEVTYCRERLLLAEAGSTRVLSQRFTRLRRDSGFGGGAEHVSRSPKHCKGPHGGTAGDAMFWQTALSAGAAYVTVIDAAAPKRRPYILEVSR